MKKLEALVAGAALARKKLAKNRNAAVRSSRRSPRAAWWPARMRSPRRRRRRAARRRLGGRRGHRRRFDARRHLPAHVRHRRRCLLADLRRRRAQGVATSTAAAAPRQRPRSSASPARREIPSAASLPATLTTPGAVASFCEAHARYGRLPLARCLQDAIHYARDGFPVSARLARWIAADRGRAGGRDPRPFPAAASAPAAGRTATKPRARATRWKRSPRRAAPASTKAKCAKAARRAAAASSPSAISRRSGAHWGEPIRGTYRGVTIYETPPPTQGFTVLEMLNLIEPLELGALPRPRSRASAGAGEADRLPRPRPLARPIRASPTCRSST